MYLGLIFFSRLKINDIEQSTSIRIESLKFFVNYLLFLLISMKSAIVIEGNNNDDNALGMSHHGELQ